MTFSTHPPFFMKSLNNKLLTHQFKNYSSTWASLTDKPICVTEMNGATQSSTQLLGRSCSYLIRIPSTKFIETH